MKKHFRPNRFIFRLYGKITLIWKCDDIFLRCDRFLKFVYTDILICQHTSQDYDEPDNWHFGYTSNILFTKI